MTDISAPAGERRRDFGARSMAVAAGIGFILILIAYLTPHGPIAQSWGALVVVVSTALMFFAAIAVALIAMPHWLFVLLDVLIVLDIAGSAVCAYFLETYVVLALMAVALLGWLLHIGGAARSSARVPA